jgi:putative addiction module component (TIGR02574 family)
MTDLVAELSAQARALPPEARARLAEELLASLAPHDTKVRNAWDERPRRRIEEVERGAIQPIPAEQANAQGRRQRVAAAIASLRANRFDLDGSLKDWIGQRRG